MGFHSYALEQRLGLGVRFVPIASQHLDLRECQVFGHRHVREKLEMLEHHPDL